MKLNTNTLKNWMLVLPLSIASFSLFAQGDNLIENGSFEATSGKIRKLGSIENATGWTAPTGMKSDLFAPGAKLPEIGSTNVYGSETAKEGENYAGIVAYSYNDKMPRTYLSTKLLTPLKKGMRYCVQFHVSLAESSKYASGNIGVNFSSRGFSTAEKASIIDETHVLTENNKVFTGMYSWDKVCGIYTATGGEKVLTIGNFTNNGTVKTDKISKKPADFKGAQIIAAYYYIDDVSVVMLKPGDDCGCGSNVAEVEVANIVYQQSFVPTDKMSAAQKIESQTVYFGYGKDNLTDAANTTLDLIAKEMLANKALKLQIKGHNDSMEDEMALKKTIFADMDQKRLDAVIDYLKEKGVEGDRIIAMRVGSAEVNPEINGSDERDMQLAKNRRVTFKLK